LTPTHTIQTLHRLALRTGDRDDAARLYRALRRVDRLEEWPAELGRPPGPIRTYKGTAPDVWPVQAPYSPEYWHGQRAKALRLVELAIGYGLSSPDITRYIVRRLLRHDPRGISIQFPDPHPWVTKLRKDWEAKERARCVCDRVRIGAHVNRGDGWIHEEWSPASPPAYYPVVSQESIRRLCPAKRHKPPVRHSCGPMGGRWDAAFIRGLSETCEPWARRLGMGYRVEISESPCRTRLAADVIFTETLQSGGRRWVSRVQAAVELLSGAAPTMSVVQFVQRDLESLILREWPMLRFQDVTQNITATLSAAIGATDRRLHVDGPHQLVLGTSSWIRIDDEIVRAWLNSDRQISVQRGAYGTTPTPHPEGATVHVLREYDGARNPAELWRHPLDSQPLADWRSIISPPTS